MFFLSRESIYEAYPNNFGNRLKCEYFLFTNWLFFQLCLPRNQGIWPTSAFSLLLLSAKIQKGSKYFANISFPIEHIGDSDKSTHFSPTGPAFTWCKFVAKLHLLPAQKYAGFDKKRYRAKYFALDTSDNEKISFMISFTFTIILICIYHHHGL